MPTDEIPRRIDTLRHTPGERAIREAVRVVEEMGADPRLTDAVVLLDAARTRVADYVDEVEGFRTTPQQHLTSPSPPGVAEYEAMLVSARVPVAGKADEMPEQIQTALMIARNWKHTDEEKAIVALADALDKAQGERDEARADTARLDGIFAWGGIDDGEGGRMRSREDVDTILLASPTWSPLQEALAATRASTPTAESET